MKTRYNWDEFPEWANFAATDFNGNICVSESMPELSTVFEWWAPPFDGKSLCIENVGKTLDWRSSLECRPGFIVNNVSQNEKNTYCGNEVLKPYCRPSLYRRILKALNLSYE